MVSGVAMLIDETRITVQRHRTGPLHIDGTPLALAAGEPAIVTSAGIRLQATEVRRGSAEGRRFQINWRESTIAVDVFQQSMSVHVTLEAGSRPTGLLGDGDGEPHNDLMPQDSSTVVDAGASADVHDVFGDSWRIAQEASLFDYELGTDTNSFTDRSFPTVHADVGTLDAAVRQQAAEACRAAGITVEPFHSNCVLDFALTGSSEFIGAAGDAADQAIAEAECAVRFDGVDDELLVKHWFDSPQFTFEAWVHAEAVNQNAFVTGAGLATYGAGDRSAWSVWLMAPGGGEPEEVGLHAELNVDLTTTPWTVGETGLPTDPVGLNRWVHLAATYDGASTRKLYINGQLVDTAPWSSAINTNIPNRALVLGNEFLGLNDFFGGEMDEVRVWSTERTESEIAANHGRKIDPETPGLELYLQFDECGGQRVTDSTNNFRHGTLGSRTIIEPSDPKYVVSRAPVAAD